MGLFMKRGLLVLSVLFLLTCVTYGQVGVGTQTPNESAQLDVVAGDKGVLLPRVQLTGKNDLATISNGNIESLLVFNTATTSDLAPGYYYWHNNTWNRISIEGEGGSGNIETGSGSPNDGSDDPVDPTDGQIYIDTGTGDTYVYNESTDSWEIVASNVVSPDINNLIVEDSNGLAYLSASAVTAIETLTTIAQDAATGTITYTDEDGAVTVLDLGALIGNAETLTTLALNADGVNLDYTDESGNTMQVNLGTLVAAQETLTTLVQDATAGTLTYTDEDGAATVLDLGALIGNAETLTTMALNADGVNLDYVDEAGNTTQVNLGTLVAAQETLTTLVQDAAAATITYTDEDGAATVIDLNLMDIDNQDLSLSGVNLNITDGTGVDLTQRITLPMLASATNPNSGIFWDGTQWLYQRRVKTVNNIVPDSDGNIAIPIGNVYTGPTTTTSDIDVNEIGGTPNEGDIYIVNSSAADPTQVGRTYIYDSDTTSWVEIDPFNSALYDPRYVNISGDTMTGNLDMGSNLITSLGIPINANDAANKLYVDGFAVVDLITGNKVATITEPDGTSYDLNETITEITQDAAAGTLTYTDEDGTATVLDLNALIADAETLTTLALNADGVNLDYTDEAGNTTQVNLGTLVAAQETLTSLVDNGDGTLTYTDEDGLGTNVDIATIVGTLETLTALVDNGDGTITYRDEDGVDTNIDLNSIVASMETLTSLVDNGDGTLTYTDEDGVGSNIDIATIVGTLETLTELVDNGDGTITYTDEYGVPTDIDLNNIVASVETLTSLVDNGDGTLTYTDEDGLGSNIDLTTIVRSQETLTTLVDNGDGTLTYTDEDGLGSNIDLTTAVTSLETVTSISQDGGAGTITYNDENGNPTELDLNAMDIDNQDLSLSGVNLNITDGTGVDLTQKITLPMLASATNPNSGIFWDGTQWLYQRRVKSVNNIAPDSDGNIAIPVGNVYTGPTTTTADIDVNEIGGTPNEGDIYIVNSSAADATQVGRTYIYDSDTSSWVEIDPFNAALYDPRYVNISGDTMAGDLDMGSNSITNLATPVAGSDAANKVYVDGFDVADLITGNKIATVTEADGTSYDINETITMVSQDNTTGVITFTDEAGNTDDVVNSGELLNVISEEPVNGNAIKVGADGGAYINPLVKEVYSAEYAGATLYADGTDNIGVLTSDNTGASGSWMNYYEWSSSETTAQDYDVVFRFTLPNDFSNWGTIPIAIDFQAQGSATFSATMVLEDGTPLGTIVPTSSANWTTATINPTSMGAGQTAVIVLKMTSAANDGDQKVRIGDITLNYLK
tara:strand:- start:7009 stop:10914 length:3906 start_codon:yes stop_codon:yes gene_type:complete